MPAGSAAAIRRSRVSKSSASVRRRSASPTEWVTSFRRCSGRRRSRSVAESVVMRPAFLAAAVLGLALAACSGGGSSGGGGSPGGGGPPPTQVPTFPPTPTPGPSSVPSATPTPSTPLRHLVFIIEENRSFDNLFGAYPGADGVPTNAPCQVSQWYP